VYKGANDLAMKILELSRPFPIEEKFALTSQIRRSSRSVCFNLREVWAKRRYEAHFVSKLTDSGAENGGTNSSLDFARDCGYISGEQHEQNAAQYSEVGRMFGGPDQETWVVSCCRPSDL
jgi:four helix bundle protein